MKTMSREVSVSALFPPRRPLLCHGEAGEGKKKVRGRRPRALLLFDYGYPARSREPLRMREVSATKGARK